MTIAHILGVLLGLGAMAGILQTMNVAVDAREYEISVLRAIGFDGIALAAAVTIEAMLLAICGALLGCLALWLWLDGNAYQGILPLSVTPLRLVFASLWALGIALLGASLPAMRATRVEAAEALRG